MMLTFLFTRARDDARETIGVFMCKGTRNCCVFSGMDSAHQRWAYTSIRTQWRRYSTSWMKKQSADKIHACNIDEQSLNAFIRQEF